MDFRSLEYVISGEKISVLIKFRSSIHFIIAFNVMEFGLYILVFPFAMINLLPLVLR